MPQCEVIPPEDAAAWCRAIETCAGYDSYHLPAYQRVMQDQGDGTPRLFFYRDTAGRCAALPLLLRPLNQIEGLADEQRFDAASAYGYPGLTTNVSPAAPDAADFRRRLLEALFEAWRRCELISVFIRQNPFFDTQWLLQDAGEVVTRGVTVAIDLTLSVDEQFRRMRRDHRYDIRRAVRDGLTVVEDPEFRGLDTFIRLYRETMQRVGAGDYYYFGRDYFETLKQQLGDRLKILFAKQQDQVIAGALFMLGPRIVQYHLSGSSTAHRRVRGAVKCLIDHMRTQATEAGFDWLHLGGGLGSQQDSLFEFKAGFSPVHLPFKLARVIVDPEAYESAVIRHAEAAGVAPGSSLAPDGFFPAYRKPLTRRAA